MSAVTFYSYYGYFALDSLSAHVDLKRIDEKRLLKMLFASLASKHIIIMPEVVLKYQGVLFRRLRVAGIVI